MREIKFRIWNIKERRYIQEFDDLVIDFNGIIYESLIYDGLYEVNQENYIVECYTGLKDKKGVEIYENDKIWCESYNPLTGVTSEYNMIVKDYIMDTLELMTMLDSEYIYNVTVIGNIHEE